MALRWNDDARTLDLGVRDLIEVGDRRARITTALSDRARMRAGAELHRERQAARAEDVASEVTLRHSIVVRGWTCTVHGRADLVAEEDGRTVIEEIKSTLLGGDALARAGGFPAWERQLAFYVSFAAAARRPDPVGRLRVVSLLDGAERVVSVALDAGLDAWMAARLDGLVHAREERLAWQARRRNGPVRFAHDAARPGQDEIGGAVADAVHEGRHLLLVAPTGVGKTAAVLQGAVRATAATGARLWWATARTTQQAMVERTAAEMARRGTPLRSVTLRARERACRRYGEPCDPGDCPLLTPAPHLVDAAIDALIALGTPDADALAAVAATYRLCAYDLALEWLPRCDLVIADYNYVFDPGVRLREALADAPFVVIVEEAHQLPDRAMDWGSPALDTTLVARALEGLPDDDDGAPFLALAHEIGEAIGEAALLSTGEGDATASIVEVNARRWIALRDAVDALGIAHAALRASQDEALLADPWVDLARAVHRFVSALERAGDETVALWSGAPAILPGTRRELPGGRLALSCRDPARVLGPSFTDARATVAISATLDPTWFFRERCGMEPDRVDEMHVPSPFPPENRAVFTVAGVSTEYKHRARDRDAIVSIVQRTLSAVPGNTAVFFGSFEQLREVMGGVDLPDRELLEQTPLMDEAERGRLLDRMRDTTARWPRVLAGVLGGLFSEGVDLPGDALRAVLVVGPALPPPTLERKLLTSWYEERFGEGFALAYVQPGMTKVVQAAGRVVRRPEDRGVVVLICQRFLRNTYAERLPPTWVVDRTRRPWERVAAFFSEIRGAAFDEPDDALADAPEDHAEPPEDAPDGGIG